MTATLETDVILRPPELVNLAGQDTGRDTLSHSSLSTLLTCQQRWYWDKERRLDPAVKAAPLELGDAFAKALQAGDPLVGGQVLMAAAETQQEAAIASPWVAPPDEPQVEINAQIVMCAARAYLDRYGHDERREVELRARIRNPAPNGRYSQTHDLAGRVDGLDVENAVLIEDKLSGKRPPAGSLDQRLRLDRQVSIGCYLAWRCHGVEIREVRYRITLKPGIKRRKDESHKGYLDRIATDYRERPDFYLVEASPTRSLADFLRLERELWRWAEQVRDSRRDGVWPRNTDACQERYGSCRYLSLCADEPGAIHQFVERPARGAQPPIPGVTEEQAAAAVAAASAALEAKSLCDEKSEERTAV